MRLLNDHELHDRIATDTPIIEGLELPKDHFAKSSPIQPASIDLHIGHILLPDVNADDRGGINDACDQHCLESGATAVITTKETLSLPGNIAAFGFPPERIAFGGLLTTNPGHVDPGYRGSLRLTIINMGRHPYALKSGDIIFTMLFTLLATHCTAHWGNRTTPNPHKNTKQSDINRLSKDFLDVDKRAENKAKSVIWRYQPWLTGFTIVFPILASLLMGWLGGLMTIHREVGSIKSTLDITSLEHRIEDLENSRTAQTNTQDNNTSPSAGSNAE